MLKEGNKYTAVADRDERFALGEVKNELLQAMGLNTETPGSVFSFLRTGYKVWHSPCLAAALSMTNVELPSSITGCKCSSVARQPHVHSPSHQAIAADHHLVGGLTRRRGVRCMAALSVRPCTDC